MKVHCLQINNNSHNSHLDKVPLYINEKQDYMKLIPNIEHSFG